MKYPDCGPFKGLPEELKARDDRQIEEKDEIITIFDKLTSIGKKIGIMVLLEPDFLEKIDEKNINDYLTELIKKENNQGEILDENTNTDINELKKIIEITKYRSGDFPREDTIKILSKDKENAKYIKSIKLENRKEKFEKIIEGIENKLKGIKESIGTIFSKKNTGEKDKE